MTTLPTDEPAVMALLDELPDDVPGIVAAVRGCLLHPITARQRGIPIDGPRQQQLNLRSAAAMLRALAALAPTPLIQERPNAQRLAGTCRDYTVLAVTLLRSKGYAARARCGFARYLAPVMNSHIQYVDHWVSEYWHPTLDRWALVDEEMGPEAAAYFKLADPADLSRDEFLTAGDAWQRCRAGDADPHTFGIFDLDGWPFIAGNLLRDVAALNGMELLPWDLWGLMLDEVAQQSAEGLALLDEIAALSAEGDAGLDTLRARYAADDRLRVPPVVFTSYWGQRDWFEDQLAEHALASGE